MLEARRSGAVLTPKMQGDAALSSARG